jgi:hypothetical protein
MRFSQIQFELHNKAIVLLNAIEENRLKRIEQEVQCLNYQYDPIYSTTLRKLHIDGCHTNIAEIDTQRMELIKQYADLMQQLIEPVVDRISK